MRQTLESVVRAMQVLFAKPTIKRKRSPFEIDLDTYDVASYDNIVMSMTEIERKVKERSAKSRGMRFTHLPDGTALFYAERAIHVPYHDFVARVDIGHVAQFYRDCVSTTTQVVEHDDLGRQTRQGVRIVLLPQPNYTAFFGSNNLDVYKLQKIDYTPDEQRVWMITVHSPNESAVCDDGYVSFSRSPDGLGTVVAMLGCLNLPIPPLMVAARLDRWTWMKNLLIERAYRRFFNTMIRNMFDCYEGKEFRVGRPSDYLATDGNGNFRSV